MARPRGEGHAVVDGVEDEEAAVADLVEEEVVGDQIALQMVGLAALRLQATTQFHLRSPCLE